DNYYTDTTLNLLIDYPHQLSNAFSLNRHPSSTLVINIHRLHPTAFLAPSSTLLLFSYLNIT
ncbi:hypothetical protein MYX76_17295, partial [Desulfobacterota bacterium AH_259_B03_O07]|nr:hypothetical protein [Desulfobacterota bacterium AH_259_B03_O07]